MSKAVILMLRQLVSFSLRSDLSWRDEEEVVVVEGQHDTWAVLVAGSKGWVNYRHQVLNICLLYNHLVGKKEWVVTCDWLFSTMCYFFRQTCYFYVPYVKKRQR